MLMAHFGSFLVASIFRVPSPRVSNILLLK
jgi:hypothetical protein